jgi:hypothetical protein
MGSEPNDTDGDATRQGWHPAVTWSGLLVAALLVYELTHQPALGVAALCVKFGWQDFKTARWLRRYDPWRARGSACWWMYLGWGLLKVVFAAQVVTAAIGFVAVCILVMMGNGAFGRQIELAAMGAMVTFVVGMGLCFLATLTTLKLAHQHRVSLWLNSSVSYGRRHKVWPPFDPELESRNCLVCLAGAFFMGLAFSAPLVAVVLPDMHELCICVLIGSFVVAVRLFWLMSRHIIASSPDECWPPDELAAECADPLQ